MKSKNIAGLIAITAIVVVIMLSGCANKEQTNTAGIKEMILASVEKIDTYKFDMDLTQETLISNETDETEMTTVSTGKAVVDASNKIMSLEMTSSIETPDKAEMPDGPMEITMVMYLVDNAMYMKMDMGIPEIPVQWRKIDMPEGYEDSWDSQNQMEQQIELLRISEVDLLKAETVNGVDCYVLKITPDMDKYSEFLMKQGGMSELMQGMQEDFDIGNLIKGMSITQWIAKDTLFPTKTEMQMKMVISSEDLNLEDTEETFTMTLDQSTTLVFYDYNEPVNLELPEDAKNAGAFPMFPAMTEGEQLATP
jgi:uncharacterized lipoprotein NlpE involved in copper resistance